MPTAQTSLPRSVLPLLLALSVTGCSALLPPPPQPVAPVRVPPPPAELMQPPACGSCSQSVLELFKRWQKLLTPTPSV